MKIKLLYIRDFLYRWLLHDQETLLPVEEATEEEQVVEVEVEVEQIET